MLGQHTPATDGCLQHATVLLEDGTVVGIRGVTRSDFAKVKAFYRSLSATSRYMRFQVGIQEVSDAFCQRLCSADMHTEVALIAGYWTGRQWNVVGDARYFLLPNSKTAEFSIAVADEWQRRGVGSAMLSRLLLCAEASGVSSLVGDALNDNLGLRQLARRFGGRRRYPANGASGVRIVFDL